MTFFCILCALLIEQIRPLQANNWVHNAVKDLASRFEKGFNADEVEHGRLAWLGVVAVLVLPVALIQWLAWHLSPFAAFAWNVVVLYLTVGFRHDSHRFSAIQFALNTGDIQAARTLLSDWTGQETASLRATQLFRLAIEKALLSSHRHVFGVFFWFLLPIGPAGAVLYRLADYLASTWNEPAHKQQGDFGKFAACAFYWIDWIPVRLTATAFAVVGNFEEALYAWRNVAARYRPVSGRDILLAAGGGAMGVNLQPQVLLLPAALTQTAQTARSHAETADQGSPLPDSAPLKNDKSADVVATVDNAPALRTLQSTVGLIWRALVLWMLLLLLLSLAASLG